MFGVFSALHCTGQAQVVCSADGVWFEGGTGIGDSVEPGMVGATVGASVGATVLSVGAGDGTSHSLLHFL
jgi:hypothetical protein